MDFRGDGVGIVAITAGSTGKSSVLDSIVSILISYPIALPKNFKSFRKNDTLYKEILLQKNMNLVQFILNYRNELLLIHP